MSEKCLIDSSLPPKETMDQIDQNLAFIRSEMDKASKKSKFKQKTELLLATKTRTPEEINYAISKGVRLIGENRVQELCAKYDFIHKDGIEIHFIGALQTNKVKNIIDKVTMIHSLDRIALAQEIDKQARKIGKVMDVLCEVNLGNEESKSGLKVDEVIPFLEKMVEFPNIQVKGLMAIPPVLCSESTQSEYFQKIMNLYIDISTKKIDNISMNVLSIGMSDDYALAIEHGSTLVRIGTACFGKRNYN